MVEEHYIIDCTANQREPAQNNHTGDPEATFALVDGDAVVAAYAYCNLHGLWKA